MNIPLTEDLKDFVRRKVESGQFPSEDAVLQEALRRFRREDRESETAEEKPSLGDLIDHEAIAYCEREADDSITLEEVRAATAKIKDSMARVVIEDERAERF